MCMLATNWLLCNNLVYSLLEMAARRRLAVLITTIDISNPIKFQNFQNFSDYLELIEQWVVISRESVRRYGTPNSIKEMVAAVRKVIEEKKAVSPYLKGVLIENPRYFPQSKILPIYLENVFSTNKIVEMELSKGYGAAPENFSMSNRDLLRKTFPVTNLKVKGDSDFRIDCLEDLD
jgi:hypothetical protein